MFDPTAFENMKVVVEGAVYDHDFYGDIVVTNRQDLVNLAHLSRKFIMEMELKSPLSDTPVVGVVSLGANLENLSAELLPNQSPFNEGSTITVALKMARQLEGIQGGQLLTIIEGIWGSDRHIELINHTYRDNKNSQLTYTTECKISFGRLIKEEQMDDLTDMLDTLIESLKKTDGFLKTSNPM